MDQTLCKLNQHFPDAYALYCNQSKASPEKIVELVLFYLMKQEKDYSAREKACLVKAYAKFTPKQILENPNLQSIYEIYLDRFGGGPLFNILYGTWHGSCKYLLPPALIFESSFLTSHFKRSENNKGIQLLTILQKETTLTRKLIDAYQATVIESENALSIKNASFQPDSMFHSCRKSQCYAFIERCLTNADNKSLEIVLDELTQVRYGFKTFKYRLVEVNIVNRLFVSNPKLLQRLVEKDNLRFTYFKMSEMSEDDLLKLQQKLSKQGQLTDFCFTHNKNLNPKILANFSKALGKLIYLKVLILCGNNLRGENIRVLIPAFRNLRALETLVISFNDLGEKGAGVLSDALKDLKNLKKLDVANNYLKMEGIKQLAGSFKYITQLKALDVHSNDFGDIGAKELGKGLSALHNLNALNVGFNGLTQKGIQHLAAPIAGLKKLEQLNMAFNKIGGKEFKGAAFPNSLKDLDLSHNKLGPKASLVLANMLLQNKNLEILNLSFNKLREEGIQNLLSTFITLNKLVSLDICANDIGEGAGIALAAILKEMKNLLNIDISSNNLGKKAVYAVKEALDQQGRQIQRDLSGNSEDEGFCSALDYG